MPLYTTQNLGASISGVVQADDVQDEAIRSFERGNAEPGVRVPGLLWLCTDAARLNTYGLSGVPEAFLQWTGTAWRLFAVPGAPQLNAAGTVLPTADMSMNNRKLTTLAAATNGSDATRRDQVLLLNGSQPMAGQLSMAGHRIRGLPAPVNIDEPVRLGDLGSQVGQPRRLYARNADAAEVYTYHPFGGTLTQYVRKFQRLPADVKPRHVRGVFKARINRSTNYNRVGLLDPAGWFDVPIWEPQSDNGATFAATGMGVSTSWFNNAGTWQLGTRELSWTYRPTPLGLAGGTLIESSDVYLSNNSNPQSTIRFYIEWFNRAYSLDGLSNASGILFYARAQNNQELVEFDEFGGGGAGVLQLHVEGWD